MTDAICPGDVDADRVHEQEVLRVFLESHLVDNPPGHRERRNARRTDHGIDLLFEEQVQKFREQNTACGVEHECKKPQSQNQQRLRLQELFRLHLRRNRQPQEDRHEICQHLLRRFGKRVQNAALTNQIAEHQKAHEADRCRRNHTRNNRRQNREQNPRRFADRLLLIGHADQPLLLCGQQPDHRRLNDRHQRHVGICRNHDGAQILRLEASAPRRWPSVRLQRR